MLWLSVSCNESGSPRLQANRGTVLAESRMPGGIITGVTQVSISPSGRHFILSNRNSGTSLLYDREGNQIAVLERPMALTDSFVANRYRGFPDISLQKIAEWTDQGRPVADSIKRHWLAHSYYSAAFDSDTTFTILAWIDNVEPPPSNSFVKFPAVLHYKFPDRLNRVQPIRVVLKRGFAAAFGQDILYNPSDDLYYTDCHNDSLGRVIVAIDDSGISRFVMGDQPDVHRTNPALNYNLYSIHLAQAGPDVAYAISTLPYVYLCGPNSAKTVAIQLKPDCDNFAFFKGVKKQPSLAGIQNSMPSLKFSVANIGRISDDSLIVIWACSNGQLGEKRTNTWSYCYVKLSDTTISGNFVLPTPEGCTIRYVHYDERGRRLMMFGLCSDEKWRLFHEPLH